MAINIKNLTVSRAGKDGVLIGGGVEANIENLDSSDNRGAGVRIDSTAQVSGNNWLLEGNAEEGLIVVTGVDERIALSQEHTAELVNIRQNSGSVEDFVDKVQRSGVGRWLANQKAVEWAPILTDWFDRLGVI